MKSYCGKCNCDVEYHIVTRKVNELNGIKLKDCTETIALCNDCDERVYVEMLEKENRKNVLKAYRQATSLIEPKDIEEFRRKYAISQRELGAILGYAKMTINKYERGAIPDKPHSDYLKVIMKNDKEFIKITKEAYELARITEKTYKKVVQKDKEAIQEYKYYEIYKDIIESQLFENADEFNGYNQINIEAVFNIISYIASKVNNLTITSLNKYLWYIDMLYYKTNGISITGLVYVKDDYGPVIMNNLYRDISIASDKFERIDGEDRNGSMITKIVSNGNYDLSEFSKEEIAVIDKVIKLLKNKKVTEISDISHKEDGWRKTAKNEKISFEYAKSLKLG